MDTSETYIKMRLAAIPDMGCGDKPYWIEEPHATLFLKDNVLIDNAGDYYYFDKDFYCQLERQDQLQEMVFPKDCPHGISFELLDKFIEWYQYLVYDFKVYIYSMEQLWLAFVMKEKYNKAWTGEKWE